MNVKLKPLAWDGTGEWISVAGPRFLIGRAHECQLRLASPVVSRRHCELRVEEGKARVRDTDSRYGTFVNGERVRGEQVLQDGDQLCVAACKFEVRMRPGWEPNHAAIS